MLKVFMYSETCKCGVAYRLKAYEEMKWNVMAKTNLKSATKT